MNTRQPRDFFLLRTALGDVHHRADHAYCPAAFIAYDVAAVEHVCDVTALAAKTVLMVPVALAGSDQLMYSVKHPRRIFGMNSRTPCLLGGTRPSRGVAEQPLKRFVPPHAVEDEVPIPNR